MDFPAQISGDPAPARQSGLGRFDMHDALDPRRLTIVMWDQAYLMRHIPGGSFEDYDRVLDEAMERGYNTLRLDPCPQVLDLSHPERILSWPDPHTPYMPWDWNQAGEGPLGQWLIEFMEKLLGRRMHYTLSCWWFTDQSGNNPFIAGCQAPRTHLEAADLWARLLREWKQRFGFDGLVYVDIANEVPYFLPGFMQRVKDETGEDWGGPRHFTPRMIELLNRELSAAFAVLRREFPELRFTASIHGDVRWLDVPVRFDCLDVHFYADADEAWVERTRFHDFMPVLFTDASWHKEFSERCLKTQRAVAPMLRARQRSKLAAFTAWAAQGGMPLTTSESWASWYYYDSPDLDWGWLLEWAEWSVEDAIEFGMWGWTPHNYCQPQFVNWKDVGWHRRLTEKFLKG